MSRSFWFVAILTTGTLTPVIGDYPAFIMFLAWWTTKDVYLPGLTHLAQTVGIDPDYMTPIVAASVIFASGLVFLFLALRKPKERFHAHAATLLLGFLVVSAAAAYRLNTDILTLERSTHTPGTSSPKA
jgi:hypothetical protein